MTATPLPRRSFLKLALAASGLALSATLLPGCSRGRRYTDWLSDTWAPLRTDAPRPLLEMIRLATLAANSHNSQPWKFTIQENRIEIFPDSARRLPVVDPDDRELWISLGCALENLLIAGSALGFAGQVTYPDPDSPFIAVDLFPDRPFADALTTAIPLRQSTRSEFRAELVRVADLKKAKEIALEPGIALHFVADPNGIDTLVEYITAGSLAQYADQAYIEELLTWIRFTEKEALATLDGLYSRSSGSPSVPRWLGAYVVGSTRPAQQAESDARKLRSSAGAVVIVSETDDLRAWVQVGRVYQRLALRLTASGVKNALLNQPVEVPGVRSELQTVMNLGSSLPQLLLRFGYADELPRSLRRPVEQVLVEARPVLTTG
jgi:hypothetical protein